MKLIHGALSGLLAEVKEHGKVDGVRVALVMRSTVEGTGALRYTSWIVVYVMWNLPLFRISQY